MAMTRREFLVLGSGAGAGLALGVFAQDPAQQLLAAAGVDLGTGADGNAVRADDGTGAIAFRPQPCVGVYPDGFAQVWIPRSEMGQGVRTTLAMLVAEELGVEWAQVRVVQAPTDIKRFGKQATDSSASTRDNWVTMRQAGALARRMLEMAAAQAWSVPPTQVEGRGGEVTHALSGRRRSYTDLLHAAAALPVPDVASVPLKPRGEYTLLGRSVPRVDVPHKIRGTARFGIDHSVAGMLVAAPLRCPAFGGRLQDLDDSAVRQVDGVVDVITMDEGAWVAVVARHTWAAFEGRRLLKCRWTTPGGVALSDESLKAELDAARSEPKRRVVMAQHGVAESEGLAKAAAKAATAAEAAPAHLEATFHLPYLAHATMEPMNCLAHVQADRCDVWAPTQHPEWAQKRASAACGLSRRHVHVHTTLMGGGFGRRTEPDFVAAAVVLSAQLRRPVKLVWPRDEDIRQDYYRPCSQHVVRVAVAGSVAKDADPSAKTAKAANTAKSPARLQRWEHQVVAPSIVGSHWPNVVADGADSSAVSGAWPLYDVPSGEVTLSLIANPVPVGWWRSVYQSQTVFANECMLDEAAQRLGEDPLAFRLAHLGGQPRLRRALEIAARAAGWGDKAQKRQRGRFLGLAVAHGWGSYVAQAAEIAVTAEGGFTVERLTCAIDCGFPIHPDGITAQMEGGMLFGLSAALYGKITLQGGAVQESNFHNYPVVRMAQAPALSVHVIDSDADPQGVGEISVPAVAPAVANALFAATGKPVRRLPLLTSG